MRFFALPQHARFSNKDIFVFIIPIIFEALMTAMLGTADTLMVSKLGEITVAGVALVNHIDNFAKQFLLALAQGGSVVLAQYIGAQNDEKSRSALKNNIRIVTAIGLLLMLVMVVFKNQVLNLLFGGAEKDVLAVSDRYFTIIAFSYPFTALYYSCTNAFRVMGESKIPFISTVIMMTINLILKYIFVFWFNMDVTGAALSTLIALATVGFVLLLRLKSIKNKVQLTGVLKPDFDLNMSKKILKISVPNGLEQGMFQLGALMIAGIISGLGTTAIAGDQIARSISSYTHIPASAFVAVMLMVVGQCMGAGEAGEAKMYTRHILKLDYVVTFINVVIMLIPLKYFISIFNMSPEANKTAFDILLIYNFGSILLYPSSFAIPAALRGAGDTKFVMAVSTASMFLFRIGAAYILVYVFKLGIIGPWIAMVSDWLIRTTVFTMRFKSGKWKENRVI